MTNPLHLKRYRQRALTAGERITVWLASSFTRLDLTKIQHKCLLVCSEVDRFITVKLENNHTVIHPQR